MEKYQILVLICSAMIILSALNAYKIIKKAARDAKNDPTDWRQVLVKNIKTPTQNGKLPKHQRFL